MGTALVNFQDLMAVVPPVYLSSPGMVLNEVQKNTYLLKRFLKGRTEAEVLQGGPKIRESLMFSSNGTAQDYQPNETFNWQNPQLLTNVEMDWRFTTAHMAWTDHEIKLRIPEGASRDQTKAVYKDIKKVKEQGVWVDLINFMEDSLIGSPHNQQAAMETSTGKTPMSIPALITEDTTNYHAGGWTTIHTVDPANESGWRNQVERYDNTDPFDTAGNQTGLFDAFHGMWLKVRFESPGTREEYFTNDRLNRMFIITSSNGVKLYGKACREGNDRFMRAPNDPAFHQLNYGGVDILYISGLDTAAIYYDGSNYVAEDASTLLNDGTAWATTDWTRGPRFWWINANHIKPVFHTERYFTTIRPFHPDGQPFSWVQPIDVWRQLVCNSRRRLGIVGPGA